MQWTHVGRILKAGQEESKGFCIKKFLGATKKQTTTTRRGYPSTPEAKKLPLCYALLAYFAHCASDS